jgi:NAD(P)H-dependent flavin oxidoreductase YrpB (nitropropane dioxygenase family)
MPGTATPELAAAVARAGGVGMLGAALFSPDGLARALDGIAERTRGVFGVGFLVPFLDRACLELAASRARVVDFFYAEPDAALVEAVHRGGALAGWQVGSCDEALRAVRAGCDFLAVQGTEAGGHVRGRLGLLPLLARVLDAVDVPVLAAGGIATPRDLAAVLAAGAAGARVGTRFLAAAESGAHPRYVEALLRASGEDTVLTEAFSVMWPDAPHRVLRSCVAAAEAHAGDVVGEAVNEGRRIPIPRFAVMDPLRETTGAIEAMALYAGEGVGSVVRVEPAAEIVRDLVEGAARLLGRASLPRTSSNS